MFSLSQHGTACCALMHSTTYITFSQSGSHMLIYANSVDLTLFTYTIMG